MPAVGEWIEALLKTDIPWLVLIAGGLVLRIRQYAAYLPFGNDEAALARNIAERGFSGLMLPLGYNQGAPVLFLFIEKVFIVLFGNRDFILEIFPFLSGLLALYLFYRIAKKYLGPAGLFAVFAFAVSLLLVSYSVNSKQYSSDVMIALLLIFLADRCLDPAASLRDYALLGLVGAVAIWLSHPAALVLAAIGLVILLEKWRQKDRSALVWSLGLGLLWAAALGADYMLSLRHLVADPYLAKYWQSAFVPLPPWKSPGWFVDTYLSLLSVTVSQAGAFTAVAWLLLMLLGAVSLLKRQRLFGLMVLLPFLMALVASLLQKYPLRHRFMLFLVPLVYILVAEGLSRIFSWIAPRNRYLGALVYAALFVGLLWPALVSAKRNFVAPPRLWDMRAVVEYVGSKWQQGDSFFVSGGGETFAYYAGSYGLDIRSAKVDNSHRIVRWGEYKDDLAALEGRDRVWVIFAHFEQSAEYTQYTDYLDRHAVILDSLKANYARLYLCNIKH